VRALRQDSDEIAESSATGMALSAPQTARGSVARPVPAL